MEASTLLRGLILGFSIAAPVGPIGLLVIRTSVVEGRLKGFVTGLGAAFADGIYGLVAALGIGIAAGALTSDLGILKLVGGLFLIGLGARSLLKKRKTTLSEESEVSASSSRSLVTAFATTALLTLTNPMTIVSFAAMIAGAGIDSDGFYAVGAFVVAVFLGSALWWLILSITAAAIGARIGPGAVRWLDAASGVVLIAFGIWAVTT
jgi:threonine/homoserine/homoserine lactone efflux protein